MKRIQKWFDQIAGVSEEDRYYRARAREIYYSAGIDLAELTKPACWRRRVRIQRLSW